MSECAGAPRASRGRYWRDFPWRRLRRDYDVLPPMACWTNRNEPSGWKDGFRYTDENVRRVRRDLADPKAVVHAIGWSVYEFVTTSSSAWPMLRGDGVSRA